MRSKALVLVVASLTVLSLAACEIRVQRDADDHPTDVDVDTPLGDVSVRTGAVPSDVGLPVYPGAFPLEEGEHDSANVSIDSPFGDLRVAALKFESDASPEQIAEYYRREMEVYGAVTMCRGEIDFDGGGSGRGPRCKQGRRRGDIQVAVGTEGNFRLAAVKPRGVGSEFAVVYVRAASNL